jgi:nitrogen PTS system EIIA component
MEEIMTLGELSRYLKLSDKTLLKMVRNKEIPSAKVANQWRFIKSMIDDWLTSQMDVLPQNDLSRLIEKEYDYVPLSRLINETTIIMDLISNEKTGVLEELSNSAWNNNLISDKENLLKQLIHREKLISTSIGKGVAIPHLRKPSGKVIYEPRIIIGVSQGGVDFGSHDGEPTYIFFLILSDSEVVHLRILSKLTRILQVPEAIEEIKNFSNARDFVRFFLEQERKLNYTE